MDVVAENFLTQKYNMDRNKARAIISFYKSFQKDEALTPEELEALLAQQQTPGERQEVSVPREFGAPGVNPTGTSGPGDPGPPAEGFWGKAKEWWEETWPWSPMQLQNILTDPLWVYGMYTPTAAYLGARGLSTGGQLPLRAAYPLRGAPSQILGQAKNNPEFSSILNQWYHGGRKGAMPTPPGQTWSNRYGGKFGSALANRFPNIGLRQTAGTPGAPTTRLGRLIAGLVPQAGGAVQTTPTSTTQAAAQPLAGRVTQYGSQNIPGNLTPKQQVQFGNILRAGSRIPQASSRATVAEIEALIAQQEGAAAGRAGAGQGVTAQPGFWSRAGQGIKALPSRIGSGITSGATGLGAGLAGAAYGLAGSTAIGAALPLAGIIGARAGGEYLAPEYQEKLSEQGYNEWVRPYIPMLEPSVSGSDPAAAQAQFERNIAGGGFWSGLEQGWNQLQAAWPWG